MKRLVLLLPLVLLAALLAAGCGGGSGTTGGSTGAGAATAPPSTPDAGNATGGAPAGASARECESLATDATDLRATAIGCGDARRVMFAWQRLGRCTAAGASRSSCTVRGYRCLATRTERGLAVGCSRPGRSLAFRLRG